MEPSDEQQGLEVTPVGFFEDVQGVVQHIGDIGEHLGNIGEHVRWIAPHLGRVVEHLAPWHWRSGRASNYWSGFATYATEDEEGVRAGYGWTRARARAAFLRRWRDRNREES